MQRQEHTAWRGISEKMSDSLLITLLVIATFSISVGVGYIVARKSRRAGITITLAGSLLSIVLIVNFFEEVPVVIVATSFVAVAASMAFALVEVARMDAMQHPG